MHAVQACVKYSLCNLICLNVYQSQGRMGHITVQPLNHYSSPACLHAHRGICKPNYHHDSPVNPLKCGGNFKHLKTFSGPIMSVSAESDVVKTGSTQQKPISCVMEINVDRNDIRCWKIILPEQGNLVVIVSGHRTG